MHRERVQLDTEGEQTDGVGERAAVSGRRGEGWPVAKAVGIFVGLSVLLRLPDLLAGSIPTEPAGYLEYPFRAYYLFSLDLFALLTLLALVPDSSESSRVRAVVTGSLLFLLVYRTYDAVVVSMLHRSPIVYADASHLVGAAYLLVNASMPWRHVIGLMVGTGLFGGLIWTLPVVVRELHRCVATSVGRTSVLVANAVVWPLLVFAIVADRGSFLRRATYQSVCLSTTECLVRNVQASAVLRRETAQRSPPAGDSTYVDYWTLEWNRPPSLYLVMVESYGSVLAAPASSVPYDRFMARTADSLRVSGWHTATTRSEAPVFGGLSWLSAATLFLGTPIEYQPPFDVLRPTLPRYPHLVRLLRHQGYETAALQPPVRTRPGVRMGNPYGFDRTFYLRDLDYRGPDVGWGIVPDQYSLAVAHDRFVEAAEEPFFLFFETVTPHGPWPTPPPSIMDDPMVLGGSTPEVASAAASPSASQEVSGRSAWSDPLSQMERLFRHIQYDWRVLTDYVRTQTPSNSLVVIVGDHQPYFADTESFATPIHVLSRDERLIRRFEQYGFVPGLRASPEDESLHHAGLYSLLVRVLTGHSRAERSHFATPLPPYRPRGVERAVLLPSRP